MPSPLLCSLVERFNLQNLEGVVVHPVVGQNLLYFQWMLHASSVHSGSMKGNVGEAVCVDYG